MIILRDGIVITNPMSRKQFSPRNTSQKWNDLRLKLISSKKGQETFIRELECGFVKIFLPALLWRSRFGLLFWHIIKFKCVVGLMFRSYHIIGIFCELALACRSWGTLHQLRKSQNKPIFQRKVWPDLIPSRIDFVLLFLFSIQPFTCTPSI